MFLGFVHIVRGELDTAVPLVERGLAIATEHHLLLGEIRAAANLAHILVMLGERDRGLEYLAQARARSAEARAAHHGPVTGYGTVTASTYLAANCPKEAAIEIRQGLAAAELNARGHRARLLRLEADVLEQADVVGASERLQEALAVAVELGMRPEAAHCHLARLARRINRATEADQHFRTAITMYREMGMQFWLEKAEAQFHEW